MVFNCGRGLRVWFCAAVGSRAWMEWGWCFEKEGVFGDIG